MALDLIIRGGKVVRGSGVEELSIGVAEGEVAELGAEISGGAVEEIEARGLHIFPGVIDSHVHFNDPGGGERDDWEGVATGSAALVAGGGTCFFDMPLNALPPTLDGAGFDAKLAACRGAARADFALWGGLTPLNLDRMEELAERGVVGFKAFMANSGVPEFVACDDLSLFRGMEIAARLGLPVAVHAESESLTAALTAEARRASAKGVEDYLRTRPVVAELEAITRAVLLAEETRCALHIVHVSTGQGVEIVRRSRGRCDVTCETCPHYLMLLDEDMKRIGALAKCAPPLRGRKEASELRVQASHGGVDVIGSDHSPAPARLKESGDFFEVWGGVAGVQATLRALLTIGLPMARIAELVSENVARRFGLPGKGGIEVGKNADFVLMDLGVEEMVTREELLDRHRASPYVGRKLKGRVRRTILRGRTVFLDGAVVGAPLGQFLRPGAR